MLGLFGDPGQRPRGGGGGGGFWSGLLGSRFSCELKCYPVSFAGRGELEVGNRIILPPAALQKLQDSGAASPWLFEIADLDGHRRTHAGVLEFTAQEETCYLPYWIMQQLQAQEGDILRISSRTLPKATFAKFKPASVALHRVYNPRALLENGLRNYVTLTIGDSFSVEYDGKLYGIEVVELRPADAVCIIETDVQVEFATAKEAEAAASRATSRCSEASSGDGDGGLRGRARARSASPRAGSRSREPSTGLFTGAGRRIDGCPVMPAGEMLEDEEDTRRFGWTSPGTSGINRLKDFGDFEDMPWKQRLPRGVKWTQPPFGVDMTQLIGEDRRAEPGGASSSSAAAPAPAPRAPVNEEARARVLEAAEVRYAQNADEIERRRKEEAEEQVRQRAREAEEERERQAKEEAKRRRAAEVALAVRQQMAGKDRRKGGLGAFLRRCFSCFGGGGSASSARGTRRGGGTGTAKQRGGGQGGKGEEARV